MMYVPSNIIKKSEIEVTNQEISRELEKNMLSTLLLTAGTLSSPYGVLTGN